ncbi:hypothetical protein BZL29_6576 [Mycobacterium kansasii]|uniref:Uncharacterized protein n=1 Tax=Mycobacterium kansasii TaxID=1768 RepID=A0A1V3WML5_MYCKA|nr:hypothetical protein BZL29_6576 [Mycobacterium kansasii]
MKDIYPAWAVDAAGTFFDPFYKDCTAFLHRCDLAKLTWQSLNQFSESR